MTDYGFAPRDLGRVDLAPVEMMFWLYCPVKLAGSSTMVIPPNLTQFLPLLELAKYDCRDLWKENYVYLTAKTLWVSPENPGNRPGWHSDGFMTQDLNYVWSDRDGTLFWESEQPREFVQDHVSSLTEMASAASAGPVKQYPDKHLLRLDETVIHRVADFAAPGMRSFVKISVSRHRYNLVGNSINHLLPVNWDLAPRAADRNHPSASIATL
jgi:hypothetical protein